MPPPPPPPPPHHHLSPDKELPTVVLESDEQQQQLPLRTSSVSPMSTPPQPLPKAPEDNSSMMQQQQFYIGGHSSAPTSPATSSASPRAMTPSSRSSSYVALPTSLNPDQLLDHSHLKPGAQASLLSYAQTINMYRENAKKTNSPEVQCDFAVFMVEAAKSSTDEQERLEYLNEAEKLLKQLSARGHAESQYYLGNLYATGLIGKKGKNEDKAFPLFVQATKHHHPDAAYR